MRDARLHEDIRVGRIGEDERHGLTLSPFLYSTFVKAFYMPTVQDSDFGACVRNRCSYVRVLNLPRHVALDRLEARVHSLDKKRLCGGDTGIKRA